MNKIKVYYEDGRVGYLHKETAFDKKAQHSLKFQPAPVGETDDTEAVKLSENFQPGEAGVTGGTGDANPDEATVRMINDLTNQNKEENDRIDQDEKEFKIGAAAEKDFPLEINSEDAVEEEVIPPGEGDQGKDTEEGQPAPGSRPKARRK